MLRVKRKINSDSGELVEASFPVILSASRATDIPAFYADWFFRRLDVGYAAWINPFNNKRSYIGFDDTRLIVFWSKNPKPLLPYLSVLKEKNIYAYIQFTLNDYEQEGLEKGLPPLQERIDTFRRFTDAMGSGKVIWRFDPMILTDQIHTDDLLEKIECIGNQLKGYAEKFVFSFADITNYLKVKNNLARNGVFYKDFTESEMHYMAKELSCLNQQWNYTMATCCEKIDLTKYGIQHNKCVDDDLMIRFFFNDTKLMDFLGVKIVSGDIFDPTPGFVRIKKMKDKGQRLLCGCIESKDIGEYNTCLHQCEYCYANTSKEQAHLNNEKHRENQWAETITGR